jgi:hypothetical protein
MYAHLGLTWAEDAEPATIEAELVRRVHPPLNVRGVDPEHVQAAVVAAKNSYTPAAARSSPCERRNRLPGTRTGYRCALMPPTERCSVTARGPGRHPILAMTVSSSIRSAQKNTVRTAPVLVSSSRRQLHCRFEHIITTYLQFLGPVV